MGIRLYPACQFVEKVSSGGVTSRDGSGYSHGAMLGVARSAAWLGRESRSGRVGLVEAVGRWQLLMTAAELRRLLCSGRCMTGGEGAVSILRHDEHPEVITGDTGRRQPST